MLLTFGGIDVRAEVHLLNTWTWNPSGAAINLESELQSARADVMDLRSTLQYVK